MPAEIGKPAPDFNLPDGENKRRSLADVKGDKTLIVFIPFPFTGICQAELCQIRDDLGSLESLGAKVAVITCAARNINAKWAEEQGFTFPILSDYWPHGATAQAYGSFNEQVGAAWRHTFVLDSNGVVRAIVKTDELGKAREYDEYKKALSAI